MINPKDAQTERVKAFVETWCVGQNKAITVEILSDRTRTSPRKVRKIVSDLACKGIPIASSIRKPYGIFIPRTRAEANECLGHLKSRIKSIYLHARGLEKGLQKKFGDSQLVLGLDLDVDNG